IDELINQPDHSQVELNAFLKADLRDAYFFSPDLAKDTTIINVAELPLSADLEVEGTLTSLDIAKADVNWGNTTRFSARGSVKNPMDTERLYVDFPVLDFKSARSDLIHFVDESGLGIRIPEEILLESKISGSLSEMVATVLLKIPEGEVNLDGQFSNNNQIVFNADLQVN